MLSMPIKTLFDASILARYCVTIAAARWRRARDEVFDRGEGRKIGGDGRQRVPWSCAWLVNDGCRVTRFTVAERAFHEQKDKRDWQKLRRLETGNSGTVEAEHMF